MMNHEYFKDRLSAYYDMELKNEEHVIVHEHIQSCSECQAMLKQFEKLNDVIDEHAQLNDDDYWEQSAKKIEAMLGETAKTEVTKIEKSSYAGLWWKLSGVAASLALVAFVSLYEKDEAGQIYQSPKTDTQVQVDSIKQTEAGKASDEVQPVAEDAEVVKPPEAIDDKNGVDLLLLEKTETKKDNALEDDAAETIENIPTSPQPVKLLETSPVRKSRQNPKEKTEETKTEETINENNLSKPIAVDIADEDLAELDAVSKLAADVFQKGKVEINSFENKGLVGSSFRAEQSDDSIESANLVKLAYWQRNQMSNQNILDVRQNNIISYSKQEKSEQKKSTQLQLINDTQEIYNQIFESYFNIALLSKDSLEQREAVDYLKKMSSDLSFPYMNEASQFMYKYDSVITLQNRIKINK